MTASQADLSIAAAAKCVTAPPPNGCVHEHVYRGSPTLTRTALGG